MQGFRPSLVFKNCVKPFGVLLRVWTPALCIRAVFVVVEEASAQATGGN